MNFMDFMMTHCNANLKMKTAHEDKFGSISQLAEKHLIQDLVKSSFCSFHQRTNEEI